MRRIIWMAILLASACSGEPTQKPQADMGAQPSQDSGMTNGSDAAPAEVEDLVGAFTVAFGDTDEVRCFPDERLAYAFPPGEFGIVDVPAGQPVVVMLPFSGRLNPLGVEMFEDGDGGLETVSPFLLSGLDVTPNEDETCLANMRGHVQLSPAVGGFEGALLLEVISVEGDTCPEFVTGPPCDATVELVGSR